MKFNSAKEMEETIKGFTKKEQLNEDIIVNLDGNDVEMPKIAESENTGAFEAMWMGTKTVDSLRVRFELDGNNIKVIETHITRG